MYIFVVPVRTVGTIWHQDILGAQVSSTDLSPWSPWSHQNLAGCYWCISCQRLILQKLSYWSAFSSGLAETLPIEYDWIWLGKQKDLKSSAALFGQQCVTSGQNSIAHLLSSVLDLLTCFYNILFLAVPLLFLHDICIYIYICIYIHMRSLLVVQQSQRMLICYLVCPKSAKHVGIGTRFQQIIPRNQPNPAWDSIPQDTQTLGRDKQIGNLWIPIISSHLTRLDFLATLGSSKCPRCSLSSHGTWGHAIAMLGQVY
jgi:hypothetical protein